MKKAVQFGAGNIGRGFMGQLFFEAGYTTVFIEADHVLTDRLNAAGRYPLRLLDAYSKREIDMTVSNISAIAADDIDGVARSIEEADVISTAVGVKNLRAVAPVLARGIRRRLEAGPAAACASVPADSGPAGGGASSSPCSSLA